MLVVLDLDSPLLHPQDDNPLYKTNSAYFMTLARADAAGTFDLDVPVGIPLTFVNEFAKVPTPGQAMLVELAANAGAWYKVMAPGNFSFDEIAGGQ